MHYSDNGIKIKIIAPKGSNNLLANATLSIDTPYGFITIKGFQIWRSNNMNDRLQEAINIAPPSKQAFGHYYKLVFFEEIKNWYELERLIYSSYQTFKNKVQYKSEDIDPNTIPL